jgi:hypothetical protein
VVLSVARAWASGGDKGGGQRRHGDQGGPAKATRGREGQDWATKSSTRATGGSKSDSDVRRLSGFRSAASAQAAGASASALAPRSRGNTNLRELLSIFKSGRRRRIPAVGPGRACSGVAGRSAGGIQTGLARRWRRD